MGKEQISPSAVERRLSTTQLARKQGSIHVREQRELFQVSEITIQSDLEALTQQGFLLQDRDGAIPNENRGLIVIYAHYASRNLEAKHRPGHFAATLVTPPKRLLWIPHNRFGDANSLSYDPTTVITNA